MEADTVLITNDIFDIQKKPLYFVEDNIQDTVYYRYNAQSNSNSSLIWNNQLPSLNLMMDKNVLVDTYINLLIRITGVPINSTAVQISQTDFVQNFPFNRLINTETFQFNSQNRTVQLQFILDELIRQMNEDHLEKMSDLTCVLEDSVWGMYSDGVNTNSNVLASGNNTSYAKFKKPRGASNIISFLQIDRYNAGGVFQDNSPVSTATTDYWLVSLQIHTVEPLIGLSPLNYENGSLVKGGIIGLNQLNLNIVTDESCSRIFSTANTTTNASSLSSYITSVSMGLQPNAGGTSLVNLTNPATTSFGFSNPQLLIKFCTPSSYQIKQMGDLGNYHPFKDYSNTFRSTLTQIASGASTQVQSNSIQLGTNPSRMYIFVRLPVTTTAYWNYAKTYFAITACDITYGNKSGILSSANQAELYRLSKKNGSKQTFEEFSGYVLVNSAATGGVIRKPSIGSLLVLDPTRDFNLPESIANNSLGQFNINVNLTVTNQMPFAITPEIVIICEMDGMLYIKNGDASQFMSSVSQDTVFKAKDADKKMSNEELMHLSGGSVSSAVGIVRRYLGRLPKLAQQLTSHGGTVVGGSRENRIKGLCH